MLSDSNYVRSPALRLDPQKTVFVGALHGMLNAEGLAHIMNDLFGGVLYAGIDTDKYKYPIGSGRVTFNNNRSYMKVRLVWSIDCISRTWPSWASFFSPKYCSKFIRIINLLGSIYLYQNLNCKSWYLIAVAFSTGILITFDQVCEVPLSGTRIWTWWAVDMLVCRRIGQVVLNYQLNWVWHRLWQQHSSRSKRTSLRRRSK